VTSQSSIAHVHTRAHIQEVRWMLARMHSNVRVRQYVKRTGGRHTDIFWHEEAVGLCGELKSSCACVRILTGRQHRMSNLRMAWWDGCAGSARIDCRCRQATAKLTKRCMWVGPSQNSHVNHDKDRTGAECHSSNDQPPRDVDHGAAGKGKNPPLRTTTPSTCGLFPSFFFPFEFSSCSNSKKD
jgi:hypothetical protein